ncbi:Cytochrome c family protein [Bathymodiolus heckerae thiotrophic gill symbiont]|uniref:Tll0287-like domain-containing protein n=1 Tax=Bathymodiolus heckerae thiotrophic gill symbiont TaxID=1052212 RepID=UPI0010B3A2A6|nr:DUF3365 domain-containing protein [Bathymodiolus heckerae thiotrophic gill symbiont]SMN13785.1 Cytochrome c family protein [Bathymodiolus heckerae thiotrophic gill symbiont]SMN15981.1 Cytochrome c family protein [uncultured Candidatus Thioglobus sp.]
MIKKTLLIVPFLLTSCMQEVTIDEQRTKVLKKEAVAKIKSVASVLKPQLKAAIKSGGFVHALKFCSVQAPIIGKNANKDSDWSVRRISLKNRNPNAVPDAWEAKALHDFNKRAVKGENIAKMAFSEVVNGEFRFIKAQGTQKVCLACHGKSINTKVLTEIEKAYPNDKATGYSLGEVRGAFSLRKEL